MSSAEASLAGLLAQCRVEGRERFDLATHQPHPSLPDGLKVRGERGKWLLRRWLDGVLPQAKPFAPKRGFTVPVGAWIAAQGDRLGRLVAAQPGVAEIAEPDRVQALFRHADERHKGFAAWTLLFYALWHRAHVLGRPADGDVFEALATPN